MTLYSDDAGKFDACTVAEQATPPPPPPPPPPTASLLLNGGFELRLSDWQSCSDDGATQTVDDASEGNAAVQITGGDCLYQEFAVEPNERYTLECDAKGTQTLYTSATLSIMNAGYTSVASDEQEVTSSDYQALSSTLDAPPTGAIGAVTLYSDDTGTFDACRVGQP